MAADPETILAIRDVFDVKFREMDESRKESLKPIHLKLDALVERTTKTETLLSTHMEHDDKRFAGIDAARKEDGRLEEKADDRTDNWKRHGLAILFSSGFGAFVTWLLHGAPAK